MTIAKAVRSTIFWAHLCVAVVIGVVVFIMSVTGVILAYEREFVGRPTPNVAAVAAVTPDTRGAQSSPDGSPSGHRHRHHDAQGGDDDQSSATGRVTDRTNARGAPDHAQRQDLGGPRQTDQPADGARARPSIPLTPARAFFSGVERIHRSLSLAVGRRGDPPGVGRSIARVCTVAFLFLILSGIYLWFPRRWSMRAVRRTALFHRGAKGRYRDWNWHHVFGFWMALPLLLIVGSATLMSYQAPRLAFEQLFGIQETAADLQPPRRIGGEPGAGPRQVGAPGGHTLPQTPPSPARKFRMLIRGIHTGQVGGFLGETIAALASLAAAGLVWTGFALAIRRFWRKFRPASAMPTQS